MTQIKDGGPAFPQDYKHTEVVTRMQQLGEISTEQLQECTRQLRGVSVRDYFAGKALPAIYADCMTLFEKEGCPGPDWRDGVAKDAYLMADAMLRARGAT